jgi:hypothetical protein
MLELAHLLLLLLWDNKQLASASDATSTDGNATAECFLDQFRSLTPAQAIDQGVALHDAFGTYGTGPNATNATESGQSHYTLDLTTGSAIAYLILAAVGALLMICGARLVKPTLFLAAVAVGGGLAFVGTSWVFNVIGWSNCWVLGGVPLSGPPGVVKRP